MQAAPPPAAPDFTRQAAFDLLSTILIKRRTLDAGLDALPPMPARDRAAGHRLAAAVLRRMGSLDAVLEPHLRRAPPDPVRLILRMGAASFLLLDTPAHASVAPCVALARARGLAPFAGLINAVLRRVTEHGPALFAELDGPRLDTPAWLWASWGDNARAIATAHQTEAPLDITLRPGATPPPGGIVLPWGTTVRFPAGTRPTDLPGFAEGAFWVQDAAASWPARLLNAQAHERVADLCAAPGGKTAQLAATGARVTAIERDPVRFARLQENMRRLRFDPELVNRSVEDWTPGMAGQFDAVLLDAPCSATGTIRRHPEIPHLRRPQDLTTLTAKQDRLLDCAVRLLRPGGRLIYAVCSLQPEEGIDRLRLLSLRTGMRCSQFHREETKDFPDGLHADEWFCTCPGTKYGFVVMDGFIIGRLHLC